MGGSVTRVQDVFLVRVIERAVPVLGLGNGQSMREKVSRIGFLLPSFFEFSLGSKEGVVRPLFLRPVWGDRLYVPGKTQSPEDRPDETVFQDRLFSWTKLQFLDVLVSSFNRRESL